jgi:hypothetical protein
MRIANLAVFSIEKKLIQKFNEPQSRKMKRMKSQIAYFCKTFASYLRFSFNFFFRNPEYEKRTNEGGSLSLSLSV